MNRFQPGQVQVGICTTERHISRLIQVNLERQGYVCWLAWSGREALDQLPLTALNIMVVDSQLGDMTGRELIYAIHSQPEHSHIKFILLGDKCDPGDDDGEWRAPLLILNKPMDPARLERALSGLALND